MPIIIDPLIRTIERIPHPALRKLVWFAVLWAGSVIVVGSFAYILRALLKMTF